jgi:hypothetical protein
MADSHSLIGKTLSHYRVIEEIGAGGMGTSLASSFTVSRKGNSETFNFSSSGNWVVYTVDGNLNSSSAVSAAEPSALVLLIFGGMGILLAALKR